MMISSQINDQSIIKKSFKNLKQKAEKNNEITLFNATKNGVFLSFKMLIDSIVCGSKPCIISITRIAISHKDDPLVLNDLNDS